MIPMVMRMTIQGKEKRRVNLWIPVILIWILLLALMLMMLPFVLLAGLILWKQGYGKALFLIVPMLFVLIFSMSGLKLDIESEHSKIFFNFI